MDKRAMSMTVLVTLIILLAGAIVMGFATKSIANVIIHSSDKEACKQSVLLNSQHIAKVIPIEVPLKCKSQDQTLENENDLKNAKEIIAKGMYDCWDQFGEGKLDFVDTSFSKDQRWCFVCNKIGFDSSLKSKKITGLDQYLLNEQVPLIGKTYSEFLFGKTTDLSVFKKEFLTDNPIYIIYMIDKNSYSWGQVAGSIGIGCVAGGGAGAILGFGILSIPGWAVGCVGSGVVAGIVNSVYQITFTDIQLKPYLLLANSEDIIKQCQGTIKTSYIDAGEYCKNECGKGIFNLCDKDECKNLPDFNCYFEISSSGGSACRSCPTNCEEFNSIIPTSLGKQYCDECNNCKFENNKCLFKGFSDGQFGGTGAGKSW